MQTDKFKKFGRTTLLTLILVSEGKKGIQKLKRFFMLFIGTIVFAIQNAIMPCGLLVSI